MMESKLEASFLSYPPPDTLIVADKNNSVPAWRKMELSNNLIFLGALEALATDLIVEGKIELVDSKCLGSSREKRQKFELVQKIERLLGKNYPL